MSASTATGELRPAERKAGTAGLLRSDDSVLAVLGSMKFTLVLFILSMIIVFVGSLAQARRDVWQVVEEYFRTYVAWIQVRDFFPPSMFPGLADFDWSSLGILERVPFPGGWTIGWAMMVNLLAAHILRFRLTARGGKLVAGLIAVAAGAGITWAVVAAGNSRVGVGMAGSESWQMATWKITLGLGLLLGGVPIGYGVLGLLAGAEDRVRSRMESIVLIIVGLLVSGPAVWFLFGGSETMLNLAARRVLWQLVQGTICGGVLLLGGHLLFGKRGGIAVLHVGVALLMVSELLVGLYGREYLMTMEEGQTTTFARDIRYRELVFVRDREDGTEEVVGVPEDKLIEAAAAWQAAAGSEDSSPQGSLIPLAQAESADGAEFEAPDLTIRVRRYYRNSSLRSALPGDELPATVGLGTFAVPVELAPVTGMDDQQDIGAVIFDVLKADGTVLSTHLVSQNASEMRGVPIAELIETGGQTYEAYLRFRRSYKPYEVTLLDTNRTNYIGTSTPQDYHSNVRVKDTETGEEQEFKIWMNNPLRYAGETFYQAGHQELDDGTEISTLQVVRNTGWMLPYIACMVVAVGMCSQFWLTFRRSLQRYSRYGGNSSVTNEPDSAPAESVPAEGDGAESSPMDQIRAAKPRDVFPDDDPALARPAVSPLVYVLPVVAVLLVGVWVARKSQLPKMPDDAFHLYSVAEFPVAWRGREQPLDSFARTQLLITLHKSEFKGELRPAEISAVRNEELLPELADVWPAVDFGGLSSFEGSYPEWSQKIQELTSSGEERVDAVIRPILTGRMPAVRWFLDMAARPEAAMRHRVIRIESDQLLSALDLKQRAGLSYSLEEVLKNLPELESVDQEARKLLREKREHKMTELQRRTAALFDTVRNLDSIRTMFEVRETEGIAASIIETWNILTRLGNQPAVMGVPTGREEEQFAWETVLGGQLIYRLRQDLKEAGVESREQLVGWLETELPKQTVFRSLGVAYSMARQRVETRAAEAGEEPAKDAVNREAAQLIAVMQEPYLQQIFSLIAGSAPGATPEEILADVDAARISEIANERLLSQAGQILEVLSQIGRTEEIERLRAEVGQVDGVNDTQKIDLLRIKLFELAVADLETRVGPDLYSRETLPLDTGVESFAGVLAAWRDGDVKAFNQHAADYQQYLAGTNTGVTNFAKVQKETHFNFVAPFYQTLSLYLIIIVFALLGLLVRRPEVVWTLFALMACAFVIHTAALGTRVWISGRPPVTNLYSSAVFIGWAIVGLSLIAEAVMRNGLANLTGAISGASTLMIAHYLAQDEGDTMGVMQAVLDTTFWLATHVVCITLGYAATFFAGILGMVYCVISWFKPNEESSSSGLKQLGGFVYGILCFALFLSLVGTVLGGLWADDSWGRFWGWDPKENGAMLIVLWNAVILHARWDKLVRNYGTSVLAIGGNIVTAWSWFGVNELRAGLHTYGFTEGRLLALLIFVLIQAAMIVAAVAGAAAMRSRTKSMPL